MTTPARSAAPLLLSSLRCLECSSRFTAGRDELRCSAGHRIAVSGGVPRFVRDDGYAASFSYEWKRFSRTQLDTANDADAWRRVLYGLSEATAEHESQRTFELKTGFVAEELAGKLVLDAGCGMGRFTEVAVRAGATVIGVDLTGAVDVAAKNLAGSNNAAFVQADLRRLPFAPASFDAIFSIGVLHHTPDTFQALEALVPLLRPGGTLAIWVYELAPWRHAWLPPAHVFSDVWRVVTTRLPRRLLMRLCVARACAEDIRLPGVRRLLRKVLPASDHPHFEWRVLDTFDWYSPRFQWKHTGDEVARWCERLGLSDIRILPVPVAVRARKPTT